MSKAKAVKHPAKPSSALPEEPEWAAFVALDWADRKHVWKLAVAGSRERQAGELEQSPEAVDVWACQLQRRFGGRPVAVAVEQSRGALVYLLMKYPHLVIYPIHPTTAARFREALYPSGAKDDPGDADVLLALLCHHREHLRPLQPDTPETRLLQTLVEDRRRLVDEKTRQKNRLTDRLKMYYPQALQWFDLNTAMAREALRRWPTLQELSRNNPAKLAKFFREHNCRNEERIQQRIQQIYAAAPATRDLAITQSGAAAVQAYVSLIDALERHISELDRQIGEVAREHPDYAIFAGLPGAGPVLIPRLIGAFGTDRARYRDAAELQRYSGIAPITERSGQSQWTHFRFRCCKFLRQTFHEFATHSLAKSEWARAYYELQRERGKSHHAAVRALAYKWIRILFRCWRDRVPYDERIYLESLRRRKSPCIPALAPMVAVTRVEWKQVGGFSRLSVKNS